MFIAPPQFEIKMRNQTARRSEPAVLQCQAKGEKVYLKLSIYNLFGVINDALYSIVY